MAEARKGRGGRKPGWDTGAQQVVDRVFVYGTLRSGQAARSMIANHVAGAEPATIRGTIYALPEGYPGYVDEGDGVVVGEVVTLRDLASAFALLDAYEGDEFVRILKRAVVDGSDVHAWVYALADAHLAEAQGERIASGDWNEHIRRTGPG